MAVSVRGPPGMDMSVLSPWRSLPPALSCPQGLPFIFALPKGAEHSEHPQEHSCVQAGAQVT